MKIAPLILGCLMASGLFSLQAAPLYWDLNGPTPGAGGPTPTGTWTTSAGNWNTAAAGDETGIIAGWSNDNAAVFSAGSDATGSFTVTPDSTVTSVTSITYNNGAVNSVLTINTGATIANTSGSIAVNGDASTRLAFNALLTGNAGLTKTGVGILQFNSGIPNYTGDTSIQEGILRLSAANRLPTGTNVDVSAGARFDVRRNTTIAGLSGGGSVFEGESNQVATLTLNNSSGSKDFSGQFTLPSASGTLHIVKQGAYTQTLSGNQANLNIGNTTVEGGVLVLGKSSGVNAIAGGTLTISAGATVKLNESHQIANTAILKLNGGTFDLNGKTGESFSTSLQLSASSTIAFGEGASELFFGNSSSEDWGTHLITITGFQIGFDLLRFGNNGSGLTGDQLALFRFADYGNALAQMDSDGYVTPVAVPEPGSMALVAGGGLLYALFRRKHQERSLKQAIAVSATVGLLLTGPATLHAKEHLDVTFGDGYTEGDVEGQQGGTGGAWSTSGPLYRVEPAPDGRMALRISRHETSQAHVPLIAPLSTGKHGIYLAFDAYRVNNNSRAYWTPLAAPGTAPMGVGLCVRNNGIVELITGWKMERKPTEFTMEPGKWHRFELEIDGEGKTIDAFVRIGDEPKRIPIASKVPWETKNQTVRYFRLAQPDGGPESITYTDRLVLRSDVPFPFEP